MSERRFVIVEATDFIKHNRSINAGTYSITESELERRLQVIIDKPLLTPYGAIDILLHGTEHPPIPDSMTKLQNDALEEWVEKMPQWFSIILSYGKMEHPTAIRELKDWFRKMPRR